MKVRCVRPNGFLKKDQIYTATASGQCADGVPAYVIAEDKLRRLWLQERFEVVQEVVGLGDFALAPADAPAVVISKSAAPTVDIADYRVWRDHGLQPGECVCRIPRNECPYHKE